MKILVTGANGMLGQDLCPILEDMGCFVIGAGKEDLDITDADILIHSFKKIRPDLVINAAAYTNVDEAESQKDRAYDVNKNGCKNVAVAADLINVPLIHISTDYVFDGTKQQAYTKDDIPNPINIYGKSKLEGEIAVKKYSKKYYIVRTGWLYGLKGVNFVDTMIKLKDEKEVKVVCNQTGSPTWSADLSANLLKVLAKPYGIYHMAGCESVNRYDFAKYIFDCIQSNVSLTPVTSADFKTPAKRPLNSALECEDITLCGYRESLKKYLDLRRQA